MSNQRSFLLQLFKSYWLGSYFLYFYSSFYTILKTHQNIIHYGHFFKLTVCIKPAHNHLNINVSGLSPLQLTTTSLSTVFPQNRYILFYFFPPTGDPHVKNPGPQISCFLPHDSSVTDARQEIQVKASIWYVQALHDMSRCKVQTRTEIPEGTIHDCLSN